jgi:hypothetical protein
LKEGIFVGPDIRKLLSDDLFETTMKTVERETWNAFKEVKGKVLGQLQRSQLQASSGKSVRKFYSVRLCHELKSAFPKCSSGLLSGKSVSEEQGEKFYQDIKEMETRY